MRCPTHKTDNTNLNFQKMSASVILWWFSASVIFVVIFACVQGSDIYRVLHLVVINFLFFNSAKTARP